jgi:hypothetical protein
MFGDVERRREEEGIILPFYLRDGWSCWPMT